MTREESIDLLDNLIGMVEDNHNSDYDTALHMAIKALEQEPCEDCISREKARQFLYERLDRLNDDELYDIFSRIIDDMYNELSSIEQEPSGDLISRQSAISLADDLKQDLPDDERIADMVMAHNDGILEYQTQLSLLPSVKQEPKTGHWKLYRDYKNVVDYPQCNICGAVIALSLSMDNLNYCPNCGAKMIEPQESEEV